MSPFITAAATTAAAAEGGADWMLGIIVLVAVGLIVAAVAVIGARRKAATHRDRLAGDAADTADRERERLAATQQSDSLRNGSRPPPNLIGF
ncbi:MAG: hypothetical protein LH471_11200 [Salinibacterium sp.]|nr:hypothetical protein [Salinibacterium sp.]